MHKCQTGEYRDNLLQRNKKKEVIKSKREGNKDGDTQCLIADNTVRQSYGRGFGEWDVAHYLLIRYYPATDGSIREQLCVLTS